MAVLATGVPTLIDFAKSLDPNGQVARVIEMLTLRNEILQDMPFMEGNLPTGHQVTIRTGLPASYWRMLNLGIAASTGDTTQIVEQTGMLESYSVVDVDTAKLNGNEKAFRALQAAPHYESMSQEFASTLFYGAATSPEEFIGLANRYSVLTGPAISANVIDGAGTDAAGQTSIWLIGWHAEGITGIYPRGTSAGIMHEDLGKLLWQTSTTFGAGQMMAYVEHWQQKGGVCVADWRQGVRIANIDVSNLVADSSAADLTTLMSEAISRIQAINLGTPVFYMNRTVQRKLETQGRADVIAGGQLSYDMVDGKRRTSFQGIPIHICDAILNTEEPVV